MFFVVSRGSTIGVGEIIYVAVLEFGTAIIADYTYVIISIRRIAFSWIGRHSEIIPKAYDSLLLNTNATDLFSFCSYYNLSNVYKKLVAQRGPLPPSRIIRPTSLGFGNIPEKWCR